jgi:L-threonylcarbamoyladenylate synthase
MTEPLIVSAERPESILAVAKVLREGGIAVIPTDTVYGLAGVVFEAAAVDRIYSVKRRQPEARVPVLVATATDLSMLVNDVPAIAWALIDAFWPGPLTLVLPAKKTAPYAITRGGGTVAVRVPGNKACLQLLQVLGQPVVGTSANLSGEAPATSAADAIQQLGAAVDAVLVDDTPPAGLASTVVEVSEGAPVIHRIGAVSMDHIRRVLGAAIAVREHLTTASKER